MSVIHCKICKNQISNKPIVAKETMFGRPETFIYLECSACGCLQLMEVPERLDQFYQGRYYSFASKPAVQTKGFAGWLKHQRSLFSVTNSGFAGRLAHLVAPDRALASLRFLKPAKTGAILDVGCGAGRLLDELKRGGFENLSGIDPFIEQDIYTFNGVYIQKKQIHDVQDSFDIVMFHHSFEHLADPEETLIQTYRLLKPGGHCVLRIPTSDSWAWRFFRTNWIQLDAPRHIFLHTPASLAVLADRTGFELRRVWRDSFGFQFWGSLLARRNIPLDEANHQTHFTRIQLYAFEWLATIINLVGKGDQLVVYLRKP